MTIKQKNSQTNFILRMDFFPHLRIFLKVVTINNFENFLKWEKPSRSKTRFFARDSVSMDYYEDHKGPHRNSSVKIGN